VITSSSSVPPAILSVEECVQRVIDRHPDQVQLYASGKSCVGFLFGQVTHKLSTADPKMVYQAVVTELERRIRPS
jgi:Asp-tRNA(Asn)/Glu-tRNA(Gln) amidotransferase B subunit